MHVICFQWHMFFTAQTRKTKGGTIIVISETWNRSTARVGREWEVQACLFRRIKMEEHIHQEFN